jgi:hypothetical protein
MFAALLLLLCVGFGLAMFAMLPDRVTGYGVWAVGIAAWIVPARKGQAPSAIIELVPALMAAQGVLDHVVLHLGDAALLVAFLALARSKK